MSNPSQSAGIIGSDQAAKLLTITPAFLRRLTQDGKIRKRGRGQYSVVEAVQGYITYLRDGIARNERQGDRGRFRDAQAEEIELRIADRQKQFMPLNEALQCLKILHDEAAKETPLMIARITSDPRLRAKLEADMAAGLDRIAKKRAEVEDFLRNGGELPL